MNEMEKGQPTSPGDQRSDHDDYESRHNSRSIFWGISLVAIGLFFFLDKLNIFETADLVVDWWPILLIAFGIYSGGDILTGIGVWLLIGKLGFYGLTYSTSWPVILIIAGGGIIIRSMFGIDRHRRHRRRHRWNEERR